MSLLSKVRYNVRRLHARASAWSAKSRHAQAGRIVVSPPCYCLMDWLDADSVVVDCGLGFDADFTRGLVKRYGVTSHGFDPTRKHHPHLQKTSRELGGKLILHTMAVAESKGALTFFESAGEVSGSLDPNHQNILHGESSSYMVTSIRLREIFDLLNTDRIHLLKMDIEGAEYDVLLNAGKNLLAKVDQFVIEFHHDFMGYTFEDTQQCVQRLEACGFCCYTRDNVNFLFYNPERAPKTHGCVEA
ncbi:MAG: FkbM family methyltransferase [Planctomycetota bacterium]